jgi:hypothetical protein
VTFSKEIKQIAHILYQKILEATTGFYDWKQRSQGRALLYTVIRDSLFDMIPVPAYSEQDAKIRVDSVYNYSFEYM